MVRSKQFMMHQLLISVCNLSQLVRVFITAVAGGMMIAASYSLVTEGIGFDTEEIVTG